MKRRGNLPGKRFVCIFTFGVILLSLLSCIPSSNDNQASNSTNDIQASNSAESNLQANVALDENDRGIADCPTCIRPDHVSQKQLNQDVQSYYEHWKRSYVKRSNGNTPGGGYYVKADSTGDHAYPIKSNSEAHGYGMIISALMGDREHFDGMLNMYDNHRSTINSHNMSWVITEEEYASQDSDSATDGDMDIAYSLLLAYDKWGEKTYLDEAKRIITDGIKEGDMGARSKRTMLGDWDKNEYSTRASDWMTGHMRVYYEATGDTFWLDAVTNVYDMIETIGNKYAPQTGLMPDFIVNSDPQPASPYFLEGPNDGSYFYNSCRFPFRMALDYAHNQSTDAKKAINKVLNWIKAETGGDPSKIRSGYSLNGKMLSGSNYFSTAFAAPMIAAATVDSEHQSFLNAGWDIIKDSKTGYYGDSINLLCQLLISGNWPAPNISNNPGPEPEPSRLISLNKPTRTSTIEGSDFKGKNAVDGNISTRWASLEYQDPEWIYIDLKDTYRIDRVVLNWEIANARSYQIQISSNASSWKDIYSTDSSDGGIDDLIVKGTGRYVRMYGTARATQWGYSLYEFEVYGKKGTTPNPEPEPNPDPKPSYELWDKSKVYLDGDRCSHNGHNYEAKWWTRGEEPPGTTNVWRDLGPYPTPEPPPPSDVGDSEIRPTLNNANSVITIVKDDGFEKSTVMWIDWLRDYNIDGKISDALITNKADRKKAWPLYQQLLSSGYLDIVNHTKSHPSLPNSSDSKLENEVNGAKSILDAKLNFTTTTIVAPMAERGNRELLKFKEQHWSAKGGGGDYKGYNSLSPRENEWYFLLQKQVVTSTSLDDMTGWVDHAIANDKFLLIAGHSCDGEGWKPVPCSQWEDFFSYISNSYTADKYWFTGITDATKYIREKQTAKIKVISAKNSGITLNITDTLPDAVFNYPLLVKTIVPETWASVKVAQNGSTSQTISVVEESGVKYVYYEATPDKGQIKITPN